MNLTRPLFYVVMAALVFGVLYRLFPIVAGGDALAQFFVTEDGYLMLTVARNLATGLGLSVSDGTIATNGVQPLATLIYALPYMATGGAKLTSLAGILAIEAAIAVAGLFAVRAFARGVLAPQHPKPVWPWLVAALWFIGPLALLHTMNGLETGLNVLMVALTVTYFGHVTARGGRYTLRDQLIFGSLCGLTFLARNDGAFLVTALFLVRFLHVQISGQLSFREAVMEALPPGLLSLLWAAPWLIHNEVYFGSIVPISGTAQSMAAVVGENLDAVPAKIFETMFPMLPLPSAVERYTVLRLVAAVIPLAVMATFLWRVFATRNPFRVAVAGYTLYAVMIIGYYGFFFGAQHFLSRYFAATAPLLITAALAVALWIAPRLPRGRDLLAGAGMAALVLSALLLVRLTLPGVREQGHFHVVGWVEENVAEETWVGAVQTGTLGYWHDRTINLDGKVNPEALAARRDEGNVLTYVAERSPIDVIADWAGVARWVEFGNEGFTDAFEVVVADRKGNLAILRRRDAAGD